MMEIIFQSCGHVMVQQATVGVWVAKMEPAQPLVSVEDGAARCRPPPDVLDEEGMVESLVDPFLLVWVWETKTFICDIVFIHICF